MTSRFAVLHNDDSDSSSSSSSNSHKAGRTAAQHSKPSHSDAQVLIPSYEDLSSTRTDEETVLSAVYGNDFTCHSGAWGCPKLQVAVRPPDTRNPQVVGCHLTLSVQLTRQYPYVPPTIKLLHVVGLSSAQQTVLQTQLHDRAVELAASGTVMVIELVQLVEDFLLEHNQDPTLSEWEQMKARQAQEAQAKLKQEQEWIMMDSSNMEPSTTRSRPSTTLSPQPKEQTVATATSHTTAQTTPLSDTPASTEIRQELARQRQALDAAAQQQQRQQLDPQVLFRRISSSGDNDDHDDDDDDGEEDEEEEEYDMDMYAPRPAHGTTGGRYQSDFIELGVLGRGGGGEVVKVRNRLDRRICTFIIGCGWKYRSIYLSRNDTDDWVIHKHRFASHRRH